MALGDPCVHQYIGGCPHCQQAPLKGVRTTEIQNALDHSQMVVNKGRYPDGREKAVPQRELMDTIQWLRKLLNEAT